MYNNSQNKLEILTLQEIKTEKGKQMQKKQEKENHDAMKSKVKEFVVYVMGLDPNTLGQSEKFRGMLKLSDAIEKQSFDITDEDVKSFFDAVSFLMDILSSYDKEEEAVKCFQELELESKLSFDKIIDSFLDFYKTEAGGDLKKFIGEKNARNMVTSALKNDNENKNKEKQSELFNNNIYVINTDTDKDKDKEDKDKDKGNKDNALQNLQKRYERLSKFNDESTYKQLDWSDLNLLLSDMENFMIDAIQGKIVATDDSWFEKVRLVMQLHSNVSDFFWKTAKSNVDNLLIDGNESCRLLDDNIKNISNKISSLGEDKLTNKSEYQAKIKFLEQKINVNIRAGSLSAAQIRGLHSVISSDISNELKSVSDEFCSKNGASLAAILNIKQCRNLFVNEISKIRNSRQEMSLQAIGELKEINKDLDQIFDKQALEKLNELPKTVNLKGRFKAWFLWGWYQFLNLFIKKPQITPQNSLNNQIGTVVRRRFDQFKQADFIIPLNRLIIRSLGIEPDGEREEIKSLFNTTFTRILSPMLNNDLNGQIGSLADALFNVIPRDGKSFNGVKYAINQYIGDAMMKCWVEAIFDFIRMDSAKNSGHLSRYRCTFNADMYFNNLKDDEDRKNQFKKILHDRFLECRSNIVTNIEQTIKNGTNDHEICENLLKLDIELLGFCGKLSNRNFNQLGEYIQNYIDNMKPAEKDVLSNLQLNLKFSIFNCRSKNENKAPEKLNKDFLDNLLLSPKKTEYEDAVASKRAFLDNLSPSSKKAYEQSEMLARESVNDSKLQGKGKQTVADVYLPNAYRDEFENGNVKMPVMGNNEKIIIDLEDNM